MSGKKLAMGIILAVGVVIFGIQGTAVGQAPKAKDTIILKGAPMGGVKFEHKLHEGYAAAKCETCHHAPKPEKAASSPQQACTSCHTKPAVAPMKTDKQKAFHVPTGQTGTCIDCHKAENAKGKKAPIKCLDCHKKDTV